MSTHIARRCPYCRSLNRYTKGALIIQKSPIYVSPRARRGSVKEYNVTCSACHNEFIAFVKQERPLYLLP